MSTNGQTQLPARTWDPELQNNHHSHNYRHPHREARVNAVPSSLPPPPPYSQSSEEKLPLDITQRLERKLAELNKSEHVFWRWFFEFVTCLVSALCMAAIIVILVKVDGRTLSGKTSAVTAYSVLSKLASGALLLPTSEAIGQLKWNWFNGRKSKEVWDFEIFDKASRGAWGSILLLFRTKGRSLAALGALLTLLLIANDTFFQQVINFPEQWSQKGHGGIGANIWYDPTIATETKDGSEWSQTDMFIYPLVHYFYGNGTRPIAFGSSTRPDVPVSCENSNCTFPEFKTLGVCSSCTDISPMLQFDCRTSKLDWIKNYTGPLDSIPPLGSMCGYFLNATDEFPIMMSGYSTEDVTSENGTVSSGEALLLRITPLVTSFSKVPLWGGSLNYKAIRFPIANLLVVAAADGTAGVLRNDTPIAQECILYWCVKTIKASYESGKYEEEVVSTFTNTTTGPYPWSSTEFPGKLFDVVYQQNITITPPDEEKVYGMNNVTHSRISLIFADLAPAYGATHTDSSYLDVRNKLGIRGTVLRRVVHNPWLPPNNMSYGFDRIANFMTNVMRSSDSGIMAQGPAFTIETFVHVEWAWLTFPLILLLLTLIFLGATVFKTSKFGDTGPGVWKTSAMPTLIYGLPDDMQKQFNPSSSGTGASIDDAKRLKIRLHPKKGWRVSGQPLSPASPVVVIRSNQPPPGWI